MRQYHELLQTIIDRGNDRSDRTGTGTRSCFGLNFRHDLSSGFPLLTTKRLPWKSIVVELLWFLKGDTNIKYLLENNCHIWTADAYRIFELKCSKDDRRWVDKATFEKKILSDEIFPAGDASDTWANLFGDLGPIYGKQWRRWSGIPPIDQIKGVIESIHTNPEGRRHIVSAWNPAEINAMALPPCHCLFQFYVSNGKLSCHMYQRSADVFLGVPFNIASYALLTHIVAHQTGLGVGDLIISFGDVHIYNNHRDQVAEQLSREPRNLPTLDIKWPPVPLEDMKYEHFILDGYDPHPAIHGELSVGV